MCNSGEVTSWAREQLRQLGTSAHAEQEKKYTRSSLRFHGVTKPDVNRLARDVKRRWQFTSADDFLPVVQDLWNSNFHEERTLAVVQVALHEDFFGVDHSTTVFQKWQEQATSWGHVDESCIRVVGKIALHSQGALDTIAKWAESEHLWAQRAALVAHLFAIRKNEPRIFQIEETCYQLIDEESFFIHKAIGWVLRELSERQPSETQRILLYIGSRPAGLTVREAIRKMPEEQQRSILQAILGEH